ncbi:MAG: tryptophan synthase subunit alpha [Rhodospirillaceae bacterium]|nr:MAG: tryptophan synthase subunit alpha [Rhodospirillaceae bacterium]
MKDATIATDRLARRFAKLREEKHAGLVAFVTANDPTPDVFREIFAGLPKAGADVIEVGMPFSDPMADGPSVQASSQRSLKHNTSVRDVLEAVTDFRRADADTPIVLMGYYNPIYHMGPAVFAKAAVAAGVDGVIVVDLPPEEAEELDVHLRPLGLHLIFLTAPTSGDQRLPTIVRRASGFIYHVAVTGITGTKSADEHAVGDAVKRLRRHTDLPIVVGFGIRTPDAARAIAAHADAAVVGSAIVDIIAKNLNADGTPTPGLAAKVLAFVKSLSDGVRAARR